MNHTKEKTNSTSQFISVEPPEFHKLVQTDHMVLDTTKLKNLGYVEEYNFWDNINLIIDDCILRKEQG